MDDKSLILFITCSLYGTLGSGVITLSTRITREKEYMLTAIKTTPFSIVKYICTASIVQFVLNALIIAVLAVIGISICGLHINAMMFWQSGIILMLSLYFIFVGILLGFIFDVVTLQSISMPLYFILILGNITNKLIPQMPKAITKVQMLFPGYYATNLLLRIYKHLSFSKELIILLSHIIFILMAVIIILNIYKRGNIKRRI
jgi:ABC-2 type transport system permease protein